MNEDIKKVVFICSFSNQKIRDILKLKNWKLRNILFRVLKHPRYYYVDKAVWVSDFISEFERHPEYEYHIIATHIGMRKQYQKFTLNGIHYHFFRSDSNLFIDFIYAKCHILENNDYKERRKKINKCVDSINPDIVLICGAENPEYSSVALDINDRPVYLLLQTVLNSPQRAQFIKTIPYRVNMEKRIFEKTQYFGTGSKEYADLFKAINPNAICLTLRWPSHKPKLVKQTEKLYDFVFYGRLSKNKGIEDVIKAFSILSNNHPRVKLCVIGDIDTNYGRYLKELADNCGCIDNIIFKPTYSNIEDVFIEVQKSRSVVVPGITAFNSTVRESMLMGLPVIVYDLPIVKQINSEKPRLFSAKIEDIEDLSNKMLFVYEHPNEAETVAMNGKKYAEQFFSNKEIGDKLLSNIDSVMRNFYNKESITDGCLYF